MEDSIGIAKLSSTNPFFQASSINKNILGGGASIMSNGEGGNILFSSNASACKNFT